MFFAKYMPGSTELITKQLKKIIEQSPLEARNDRIVIDEYDDYGRFKHLNVMVVNVKNKEHLKEYKGNLFYKNVRKVHSFRCGMDSTYR